MAIVIPPGGTVPPDEPTQIPCANPPECEVQDEMLARSYGWDKYEYDCCSKNPATAGLILHIKGYEMKWYRAWMQNPRPPLAHGPPDIEETAGNAFNFTSRPPPIS